MTKDRRRYLKHKPKTVLLVGMGPSLGSLMNETLTQEMMPDHHDEIWTINMASNVIHSDLVIWMDDLAQQEQFKPGLFAIMRRKKIPVLTSKRYPEILPNSYDYPIDKVARLSVPHFGKPYLNNGVAMAIGYALAIGVKTMKIYGCDFTYPNRNYAESGRGCVEAWIALASMSGMALALAPTTSLFDTVGDQGIYGYAEQPEIDLGGGTKFKYATKDDLEAMPGYEAEDSSGNPKEIKHVELPGSISGTPVRPPNAGGGHAAAGNAADGATPPAAR